jgi:hypothetical protein
MTPKLIRAASLAIDIWLLLKINNKCHATLHNRLGKRLVVRAFLRMKVVRNVAQQPQKNLHTTLAS